MNSNVKYIVSNPPEGEEGRQYGFVGEFFEIYSPPITTRYSEVYWRTMDAVPLPAAIVQRYANSSMAITGYEVDLVRRDNVTGDTSVPCYQSYNHHYVANIVSSQASYDVDAQGQPTGPNHGHGRMLQFKALPQYNGDGTVPLTQTFSEHNGNEYRQSYHGFPTNFVQPIWAPANFVFTPMQINMLNPDGSGTRGGPLPQESAAPPDASYSGLLECPCTDREHIVIGGYATKTAGSCTVPMANASACFAAAVQVVGVAAIASNSTVASTTAPSGCSLLLTTAAPGPYLFSVVFNTLAASPTPCGAGGKQSLHVSGTQMSLVTMSLDVDGTTGIVTITLTGNATVWFGVGFDAGQMSDTPYAIIVDGNGVVTERRLVDQGPGALLPTTVAVLAHSVVGGLRTVVLQRALTGKTSDYYTFSTDVRNLGFINAVGSTVDLQYHAARTASSIALFQTGAQTCLCNDQTGTIDGIPYNGDCRPEPWSNLLAMNNPTCDISTYQGGLPCCVHGTMLLDSEQDIPPAQDTVYFKWRFYYEDYVPAVQTAAIHLEWAVNGCDSGGPAGAQHNCASIEYAVPQADPGTPPDQTVYTVVSHFQASDMFAPHCNLLTDPTCADSTLVEPAGVEMVMTGGHCHAPACLSLELWNADTNTLLCRVTPVLGQGDAAMDELGYLWTPPCQWGLASEGLQAAPVLHLDTNLTAIGRTNNTYAHYGQMGIFQMRGAYVRA